MRTEKFFTTTKLLNNNTTQASALRGNHCGFPFFLLAGLNDIYTRMKPASINDIKKELEVLSAEERLALCLRLAKYKKENKELLSFLLFESRDMVGYLGSIKEEIDSFFEAINTTNIYFIKKSIRKILRHANKQIKFTASKEVEVEILIHFCNKMVDARIPFKKSAALLNLYDSQVKKIDAALSGLHPDLQYDLKKQLLPRT